MIKEIITLINMRKETPLKIIQAYQNKKSPSKTYGTYYELQPKLEDVWWDDNREKVENDIHESAMRYGEYPVQFDIYADSMDEAREKAMKLFNLITYQMRYQEWSQYGVGITDFTAPRAMPSFDGEKYEYRYLFEITFEFEEGVTRVTELVKVLDLKINNENFKIGDDE